MDWRDWAPGQDLRDPRYAGFPFLAIGWGEAGFFRETPHWRDVKAGTILRAAFGSDRTLIHVDHLPLPRANGDDVRAVRLSPQAYRRLVGFIQTSWKRGGPHYPVMTCTMPFTRRRAVQRRAYLQQLDRRCAGGGRSTNGLVDALPRIGDGMAVIPPPSKALWAAELPRALWMGATWWRHRAELAAAPRGDGRTVMVLPGLFNTDAATVLLRRYLAAKGYRVHGWRLGRNRGVRSVGTEAERLIARIESLSDNGPVTLIGISLGGIMARMAAQGRPDLVAGVVTISSPYAGPPRATNVWKAFERLTGERVDDPAVLARSAAIAGPLPCPSAAIWSRSDGLVAGIICRDDATPSVEVRSSHLWVQHRPQVLAAVATILAGWPPPVSDQ